MQPQGPDVVDSSESSESETSCSEDESTDYLDSESSDVEDFLQSEVELPQPSVHRTNQQCIQVILTWLVYFILVWQYKNYVSNNAIEQLLKFVQ